MKHQTIALKPLRELAASVIDKFCIEYPESAKTAKQLKEYIFTLLAGESADFDTIEEWLSSIDERADALDDGGVYVATQDLIEGLSRMAKKALSEGVPVLPELKVGLELSPKAKSPASARADVQGNRTKLGGAPQWIQGDDTPVCERCGQAMTFVAQIDSLAQEDSDLGRLLAKKKSFMFADAGMIYVFWCSGCNDTKAILQCG